MSAPRADELPKVFLGSSAESLPELEYIEAQLSPRASATSWNDSSFFVAGGYILDTLLQKVPTFDFAVFVFGEDDITISRGTEQASPRDNVIFEAGLFMNQLGRERTLVVIPKGVKVLSDFWGLTLVPYTPPDDPSKLWQALNPACETIIQRIAELGGRPKSRPQPDPGPSAVGDAIRTLSNLIRETLAAGGHVTIRNIALDMEMTWPGIKEYIFDDPAVKNLTWQSLMINPDSEAIRGVASSTVDPEAARVNQKAIRDRCNELKESLEGRQLRFECMAYDSVPAMHGFLVNESVLLLTLCGMSEDGKLVGRRNPYWRFVIQKQSEATEHMFRAFRGWFDYHWSRQQKVWPL